VKRTLKRESEDLEIAEMEAIVASDGSRARWVGGEPSSRADGPAVRGCPVPQGAGRLRAAGLPSPFKRSQSAWVSLARDSPAVGPERGASRVRAAAGIRDRGRADRGMTKQEPVLGRTGAAIGGRLGAGGVGPYLAAAGSDAGGGVSGGGTHPSS